MSAVITCASRSASPGPTAPPSSTASTSSSAPAAPAWSAPTASGKSTLLRLVAGELTPTAGHVARRRPGRLPAPGPHPRRTAQPVAEFLGIDAARRARSAPSRPGRPTRPTSTRSATTGTSRTGPPPSSPGSGCPSDMLDRRMGELSGGEVTQLGARAAAARPPGRAAARRADQQPRRRRAAAALRRRRGLARHAARGQPRPRAARAGGPDRRPARRRGAVVRRRLLGVRRPGRRRAGGGRAGGDHRALRRAPAARDRVEAERVLAAAAAAGPRRRSWPAGSPKIAVRRQEAGRRERPRRPTARCTTTGSTRPASGWTRPSPGCGRTARSGSTCRHRGAPRPGRADHRGLVLRTGTPVDLDLSGPERIGGDRPQRLRQDHAAAHDRRPARPAAGEVGAHVPVALLPQRLDVLDDDLTVVDNVARRAPGADANAVRARLARFLFRGARGRPAGRRRSPAASGSGPRSPRCCWPTRRPSCCCSTSRPTTSTSRRTTRWCRR